MHHQVTQPTHVHPRLGILNQSQPFGAIKIFNNRSNLFTVGCQIGREQFIAQHVLQASKTRHKSLNALCQRLVRGQAFRPFNRKRNIEQAAIRRQ
jgi:hypothetical protein